VGGRELATPPDAALRRIARLADGWSPNLTADERGQVIVDYVHRYAREAGRDPSAPPLEGRIRLAGHDEGGWIKQVEGWKALGATSVIVEPRGASAFPKGDLDVLKRFRAALA
jgi:hypothetical protein